MRSIRRALVVGQAPSSGRVERIGPLGGKAGDRIAALVGLEHLWLGFDAVNLLVEYPGKSGKGDRFPMDEARAAAKMLLRYDRHDRIVLLGAKVVRAFDLKLAPCEAGRAHGRRWLHLPHPSGVNRWWNDPANVEAAAVALRHFAEIEEGA